MTAAPCLVLGMHRSGTSAMTEALGAAGMALGPAESLVPAAPTNPHGHFEQYPVLHLNEMLIRNRGAQATTPWAMRESPLSARERRAIEETFAALGPLDSLVIKDPRLCLTLPLLAAYWGAMPRFIIIARHPTEVAASLYARDHLPVEIGEYLWLEYMTQAIRHTNGHPRVIIQYADLLAAPETQLERALDAFGATGSTRIATVDTALRHHHEPREIGVAAARHTWEALASPDLAAGGPLPGHCALTPDELAHRTRLLRERRRVRNRVRRVRRRGITRTIAMRLRRESTW